MLARAATPAMVWPPWSSLASTAALSVGRGGRGAVDAAAVDLIEALSLHADRAISSMHTLDRAPAAWVTLAAAEAPTAPSPIAPSPT